MILHSIKTSSQKKLLMVGRDSQKALPYSLQSDFSCDIYSSSLLCLKYFQHTVRKINSTFLLISECNFSINFMTVIYVFESSGKKLREVRLLKKNQKASGALKRAKVHLSKNLHLKNILGIPVRHEILAVLEWCLQTPWKTVGRRLLHQIKTVFVSS